MTGYAASEIKTSAFRPGYGSESDPNNRVFGMNLYFNPYIMEQNGRNVKTVVINFRGEIKNL